MFLANVKFLRNNSIVKAKFGGVRRADWSCRRAGFFVDGQGAVGSVPGRAFPTPRITRASGAASPSSISYSLPSLVHPCPLTPCDTSSKMYPIAR